MLRVALLAFLSGLFATTLSAQTWQAITEDDGAFAYSYAGVPNFMGLYCLGPSPKGGADATGSAYAQTQPNGDGQFILELGLPVESQLDVVGISLRVGGDDYDLPLARFHETSGMVLHPVNVDDPMIEALQASNTVRIRSEGRLLLSLPLHASRRSIDAMIAFCRTLNPPPEAPETVSEPGVPEDQP